MTARFMIVVVIRRSTELVTSRCAADMDGDDGFVPTSSTCDFRIHLPQYSTEAILKEKLLYAISLPAARKEVAVARAIEYGCGADTEPTEPSGGGGGGDTVEAGLHYIDMAIPPTPVEESVATAASVPSLASSDSSSNSSSLASNSDDEHSGDDNSANSSERDSDDYGTEDDTNSDSESCFRRDDY